MVRLCCLSFPIGCSDDVHLCLPNSVRFQVLNFENVRTKEEVSYFTGLVTVFFFFKVKMISEGGGISRLLLCVSCSVLSICYSCHSRMYLLAPLLDCKHIEGDMGVYFCVPASSSDHHLMRQNKLSIWYLLVRPVLRG